MLQSFDDGKVPAISGFRIYESARNEVAWNPRTDIPWNMANSLTSQQQEWAWKLTSSSVYAEQTGMLVAASLLREVDDLPARMCLATAVSDEAKHIEVFARAAELLGGSVGPCDPGMDSVYAQLAELTDWMERFLVHTMLEGFAMDEFMLFMRALEGGFTAPIYEAVRKDERRHVAMGLDYMHNRAKDPVFASLIERLDALEEFGFRVGGVDATFFTKLADIAGTSEAQFRTWFLGRHRARMRFALGMDTADQKEVTDIMTTDYSVPTYSVPTYSVPT